MLTQETLEHLGTAAERFLGDPDFQMMTQVFEAQTLNALLGTKRVDKNAREELYATIQSVRDFIGFMNELAQAKAASEEPVTITDTTDDPRVHDIYAED